jgi:hypothetical protein
MGIRFYCPNGHKLNVKSFLAGQKGICPYCGTKVDIPLESTRAPGKQPHGDASQAAAPDAGAPPAEADMDDPLELAMQEVEAAHHASSSVPSYPGGIAAQPSPAAVPHPAGVIAQPSPAMPAKPAPRVAPPSPVAAAAPAAPVVPSPVAVAPQTYAMPAAVPAPPAPPPPPQPAGPPDPLTEAPDSVWYVRPPSGGQFGPATSSVMRSWLQEGRISADSLVWREGWRDWQEALGVFPQLRGDDLAMLNAVIAGPGPAMPAGVAPHAAAHHHPASRGRSKKNTQVLVVAALVVLVLVLLVVFIWVLLREPGEAPADKTQKSPAAAKTAALGQRRSVFGGHLPT